MQAALSVKVATEPEMVTLLTKVQVVSAVLKTGVIILFALMVLFVKAIDAWPAATLSVPACLLIVCAPVVPPAVIVRCSL